MGIENIVAKGEIAHNEQLLPFLQQFQHFSVIIFSFEEIFYPFYMNLHFDAFTTYNLKHLCKRKICSNDLLTDKSVTMAPVHLMLPRLQHSHLTVDFVVCFLV